LIRIFIVDDHPFVREGLKTYLSTQAGIEVIGEAGDGETALAEIKRLEPDQAVIDLRLPGMGGVELTRGIRTAGLATQVIILSSFCEDEEVMAAINAGALSYLMKDSPPEKLVEAIRAAAQGEPTINSRILRKLMQQNQKPEPLIEPLTSKEKEVLTFLVRGKSNKEIGAELIISETTVKTHVSNLLRKLDVSDRTQAVIKAIELKLVNK
jgi:DNA-binding NarL/FixJ family response regulator